MSLAAALLQSQPSLAARPSAYRCAHGTTISIMYIGTDRVQLTKSGRVFDLSSAPSANGARYIGQGWQWWSTGMRDGSLAPLAAGESIASAPSIACERR